MNGLYKHQRDIILADPKRTGLWLGTGSGKTLIALSLARGKTLVIAPKTQVEDKNWERENEKNKLNVNLTVISKETFRRDHAKLPNFQTVISDECHTQLGVTSGTKWVNKVEYPKTSQLFEALQAYLKRTNPDRLYLCTATILKSAMTVWGAGTLLGKQWNFFEFRHAFYTFVHEVGPRGVWLPKTGTETKERLARIVKSLGYVGRLEDYFDVPEQTFKTDYIELTGEQKQRIKNMRTEYPDPLVRALKVHQIENGVLSGDEFNAPEKFANNKIDKLIDYSYEFTRMIVFARYTEQIKDIAQALKKTGKKVFVLNGETKDRGALFEEAKKSDEYVFIAQCTISAGWELKKCPVMIFASCDYSFVNLDQALGRIQRADNIKKNLYIYLVVKGGTDEAIHKALSMKQDFNEKLYAKEGK